MLYFGLYFWLFSGPLFLLEFGSLSQLSLLLLVPFFQLFRCQKIVFEDISFISIHHRINAKFFDQLFQRLLRNVIIIPSEILANLKDLLFPVVRIF